MMRCFVVHPRFSVESHEHRPEHVEGRHDRGHSPKNPEAQVPLERVKQDFILAEEASERKDAGNGQSAEQVSPVQCMAALT